MALATKIFWKSGITDYFHTDDGTGGVDGVRSTSPWRDAGDVGEMVRKIGPDLSSSANPILQGKSFRAKSSSWSRIFRITEEK